jgi:hypothetical protein
MKTKLTVLLYRAMAYHEHFIRLCGVCLEGMLHPIFRFVLVLSCQSVLMDTRRSKRMDVGLIFFNGLVAIQCEFSCVWSQFDSLMQDRTRKKVSI